MQERFNVHLQIYSTRLFRLWMDNVKSMSNLTLTMILTITLTITLSIMVIDFHVLIFLMKIYLKCLNSYLSQNSSVVTLKYFMVVSM